MWWCVEFSWCSLHHVKTTSGTLHSQHVSIQSFSQGRLLGSRNIAAWWLAKARPGVCPKARPCVQRSELGPRIVEAVHTCNKHPKRKKEIKLKKAFIVSSWEVNLFLTVVYRGVTRIIYSNFEFVMITLVLSECFVGERFKALTLELSVESIYYSWQSSPFVRWKNFDHLCRKLLDASWNCIVYLF